MLLRFTKMHGLGNDFVVIDAVTQSFTITSERARRLADRRFGVGCDQVLVVEPPTQPDVDFRYRIFNSNGGEVEQCGNGARCFAKFVRDRRLSGKSTLRVETASGIIDLQLTGGNQVCVNMGVPQLEPAQIPLAVEQRATTYQLQANGEQVSFASVSMGNPHCVIQVTDVKTAPVETLGPVIENHPLFPNKVNVGFMQVVSRNEINLRVFERGAGETLACGTGACAAVVAGNLQELLDSRVKVNLPGGHLEIEWPGEGQEVQMTGPATTVYHGRIRI